MKQAPSKITLSFIQKQASKILGHNNESAHDFVTMVILLASATVGPNVKKISTFTGYPRKAVRERGKPLRASGIWKGKKVHCDWFGKDGGISLLLDSLVADGLLQRR